MKQVAKTIHELAMERKTMMHKRIAENGPTPTVAPTTTKGLVGKLMEKHGLTEKEALKALEDFGA